MDRRLGGPVPHQPANQTRVHPVPPEFLPLHHAVLWSYAVLAVISDCYPPCTGQVTHALLTRPPLSHQIFSSEENHLCQDIGAALGCGGCMAALRRTKAGAFSLDQAIPLADLIADANAVSRLLGVDTLFAQYPAVTLTARQEQLCRNGASFTMQGLPAGFVRVYSQSGEFLMLGRERDGRLATEKSFFEVSTT